MKQKDLIILLAPLFILTILWVVFNVYHNYVTSTIKDPLSIQIIPIEGKFDTNTIEKVKSRQRINPLYEIQVQLTPVPSPTPEPILIIEPTLQLTPTPTEEVLPTPEPGVTP